MLFAIKKNRQLRIADSKRKDYEALGYTIKDADGNTISEPENPAKEVEKLTAENAALKAELEALKAAATVEETAEAAEETTTKKTTKAKK